MNKTNFILLYILLAVPTYILPYLGSNSLGVTIASEGATLGFAVIHIACLIMLIVLAQKRRKMLTIAHLWIYPSIALCFDMIPGLSLIPFVATTFHIITISLAVSKEKIEILEENDYYIIIKKRFSYL